MREITDRLRRVGILSLLDHFAVARERHGGTIVHRYRRDDVAIPDFFGSAERGSKRTIVFSGAHVLKSFRLSLADRLLGCRLDRHHGLLGGGGELINTLVADRLGVPSPRLIASRMDFVSGSLVMATENLAGCVSLADALERSEHGSEGKKPLLDGAFSLLADALERGLYHVDPNASNIMLDGEARRWFLIDFEQALPLGCEPATAFALQAASLFDWRLHPFIDRDAYRELVGGHLGKYFAPADLAEPLALLDEYTAAPPNRHARRRRLLMASGGNSDIRRLLPETHGSRG